MSNTTSEYSQPLSHYWAWREQNTIFLRSFLTPLLQFMLPLPRPHGSEWMDIRWTSSGYFWLHAPAKSHETQHNWVTSVGQCVDGWTSFTSLKGNWLPQSRDFSCSYPAFDASKPTRRSHHLWGRQIEQWSPPKAFAARCFINFCETLLASWEIWHYVMAKNGGTFFFFNFIFS
jgi:hypothetical protein